MRKIKFHSLEPFLFALILILNLYPILFFEFFATIDSPAHVYNSNLIYNLFFGEKSIVNDFFKINPEPVPNWTGHFIITVFISVFPGQVAEKFFQLIYFIGLPLFYRRLMSRSSANNLLLSYFIFPFTHNYAFYNGFYNFSIGIVFLFLTLNYWIKNQNNLSYKSFTVLFILLTVTYFSHLLVFGIACMTIALFILTSFINELMQHEKYSIGNKIKGILKKGLFFILASSLSLCLAVSYFFLHANSDANLSLSSGELFRYLCTITPITIFAYDNEKGITAVLFYSIAFVTIYIIFFKIKGFFIKKNSKEGTAKNKRHFQFVPGDVWLITSLVLLALYFLLPDQTSLGSIISVRLSLLFFLFFILWLGSNRLPRWISAVSFLTVLFSYFALLMKRNETIHNLSREAKEYYSVSKYIKPHSIVLPFDYSGSWLTGHYSNYLGIDKPMVILENYECGAGYFPVAWNKDKIPDLFLGNIPYNDHHEKNPGHRGTTIDYIFIYGNVSNPPDFKTPEIREAIEKNYKIIFEGKSVKLYSLK